MGQILEIMITSVRHPEQGPVGVSWGPYFWVTISHPLSYGNGTHTHTVYVSITFIFWVKRLCPVRDQTLTIFLITLLGPCGAHFLIPLWNAIRNQTGSDVDMLSLDPDLLGLGGQEAKNISFLGQSTTKLDGLSNRSVVSHSSGG